MNEKTLISTFYSFEPFVPAAHAFSPKNIILVVAIETFHRIEGDIEKVKGFYGKVASVEVVKVKGSDLIAIAEKTIDLLERHEGEKVVVNVSGGWKLLAQGVMYGCYARPDFVERIVCNNVDDNSIVELPKLTFGLSNVKKELLEEIAKRKGHPIADIANKLKKTRGMIYQHLKELKENGYVDENFNLTDAGRLALL